MSPKTTASIIVGTIIFLLFIAFLYLFIDNSHQHIIHPDKDITEITPAEWTAQNKKLIIQYQKDGLGVDTLSYEEAVRRTLAIREELNPCSNMNMINAFHEMMEFNNPNDRYKKDKIKWQRKSDCILHINVYTKDADRHKSFWIFEMRFNEAKDRYEKDVVKKEFLG